MKTWCRIELIEADKTSLLGTAPAADLSVRE